MKPLFLLLILLLSHRAQQSETIEIYPCVITNSKDSVICGFKPNSATAFFLKDWTEEELDEWRLNVQYIDQPEGGRSISFNAPLIKEPLKAKQRVKATRDTFGKLIPLARCDVRVWRQVHEFTDTGQPAPNSARRPPDDCVEQMRY